MTPLVSSSNALEKIELFSQEFWSVLMNNLIIASWNVRGLNNRISTNNIRRLIMESRANVLFLQETKSQNWSNLVLNSIWDSSNHDWISIDSRGAAGGLLISWDKNALQIIKVDGTPHWLWGKGYLPTGEIINLVNIYGPHDAEEKKEFWIDLKKIHDSVVEEPMCAMGDFNSIRLEKDRSGCVYNHRDTQGFNSFMADTGMLEIEGIDYSFTWFGPMNKKSKLDRVLVNDKWLSCCCWKVQGNHRRHSDHIPLILSSDSTNWGPKPFKAFDDWLMMEEAQDLVRNVILSNDQRSCFGILKEVKIGLKEWSKSKAGCVYSHIEDLEKKLHRLDNSEVSQELKISTFQQLQHAYQRKAIQLRQKSRTKWDLEGDCNTRFFHRIVQHRKAKNQIRKFKHNGKMVFKPSEIRQAILQDFKDFFCSDLGHTPFDLTALDWYSITFEESSELSRQFSKQEIWIALQESESRKAPGPDGFNAGWLKKVWPQISDKILQFFQEFYDRASLPQGANSSFITLIPKKNDPVCVSDFRPISLINSSFKLLLKVLANRLMVVMSKLVSEEQTAFIKGRNINESIFIVNEVVHAMKIHKIEGLIVKLDFSKAYDSIDWSCLLHTLQCMNFNKKWIQLIRAILHTTRISVLVNGSPTEEFSPIRGIRQGDPLAPYLFLFIGEILSKLVNKAIDKGVLQGINFDFHDRHISYCQYADDTILFIKNEEHSIKGLKKVLLLFQAITGLSINFRKSVVYHVSNDKEIVVKGTTILGCQSGTVPFKYLGDWVGLERKSCRIWKSLTDNITAKLQGWKCSYLNMAGRLVLTKASLESIPNYWFSLHRISKMVVKSIEGIRRGFFWGERSHEANGKKKMHSIRWEIICSGKNKGGLNLTKVEIKNLVLLSK